MKNTKKAVTLVEAMIVLLVISTGLVGLYDIFNKSTKLQLNVENRIQAIQIAREGIEAMVNIRDTNWKLFPADKKNCGLTLNYDGTCMQNSDFRNKIGFGGEDIHYKIFRNNEGKWNLEQDNNPNYADGYINLDYRNYYKVGLDSNGLYTQTGIITDLKPIFTREITANLGDYDINNIGQVLKIKSIVYWVDSSSPNPYKIELDTELTNYEGVR